VSGKGGGSFRAREGAPTTAIKKEIVRQRKKGRPKRVLFSRGEECARKDNYA